MKSSRCALSIFGAGIALMAAGSSAVRAEVPSLSVSNVTIVAGKVFTLPLDGYDAAGRALTFSVVSNSMTNLATKLVTTNHLLRLNVSVTGITIQTNFTGSSYTTNISMGQGTNALFVFDAGSPACDGVYYWNSNVVNNVGALGAYTNASAMMLFVHPSFGAWDFNDLTADYYNASKPDGIWTVGSGVAPPPHSAFDGDTPGALIITTNGVTTYVTNSTAVTGDLVLELFEHLTPKTTARIISLVNSNFYNGLIFHRVMQNFMAQGGDPLGNGTGGSGVKFDDEFVAGLTFEGFGQLALANSGFQTSGTLGRDNNDSQFFITAPNLSVAGVAPPQHLNYRHTIFGQLTHGFDLFSRVMGTAVDANARPLNNVVINSAAIITNRQSAVLYLTAPTNTSGSANLTVQAQSSSGSTQVTFRVTLSPNVVHDPPFFAPMPASLVTTQNMTVTFPAGWYGGSSNNLGLWDADTGASVNDIQVSLYNGYWYLTPRANFIGHENLLFSIYDGYDHNGDGVLGSQLGADLRAAQEYDTQRVSLTVIQPNIGAAVNMPGLFWSTGDSTNGSATWYRETGTTHDGSAALQSGALGTVTSSNSLYSWTQITTNGPGSLIFWWKASTGTNASLGLFINGVLVSSLTGNAGWQQYATYLSNTGAVTITWAYIKSRGVSGGSDCGWIDEVAWSPCPYARNVPQIFYQNSSGLLASWVVGTNASFRFARILSNTGTWALKAAGDVDGDGVSDLLFETPGGDAAGWFMNADGTTRSARYWFNLGNWEIKACGDYDGAGRSQMFFQNTAGVAAYWRLETNGNFVAAVPLGSMGGWKLRGAGDLDGDGKAELFWQNAAGTVVIWYHNVDGSIRGGTPFNTGDWALCGVDDIDGDHVSDLVWQNSAGLTGGWFMNSNGTARAASYWWGTGDWKLKATGH